MSRNRGEVSIERHGKVRYERTLSIISSGGQNVGDTSVAEDLARYWP